MVKTRGLCPSCDSMLLERVPPASLLDSLASLVSIHPYECKSCHRRIRIRVGGSPSPSGSAERRQSRRVSVKIPVTFESGEEQGQGVLTDISIHGCTLDTMRRLRPGLVIRLHLPEGNKPQVASVLAVNGSRAGLKFLASTPQDQDALTQTVTSTIRNLKR